MADDASGGLLNFLNSPTGVGLLSGIASYAANARRDRPFNSLGVGLVGGLAGYGESQERQMKLSDAAKVNALRDAQIANFQSEVAERDNKTALTRRKQEALPSFYTAGGVTPGDVSAPDLGGVPMFSQGVKLDSPPTQTGPSFNWLGAVRSGLYTPDEIEKYAKLTDIGRPEVARTVEVDDGRGGKETRQLDKFGQPVGGGLPSYIAPVQVNQGDRSTFVKPTAGVSLPINMSPGERASNAVAWANNALGRERLGFDRSQADRAVTYQQDGDGNFVALPTKAAPGSAIRSMPVTAANGTSPLQGKSNATEDQSKAAGWLVQATNAHANMLKALGRNPSVSGPGWADGIANTPGLGGVGNWLRPDDRQQFLQGASSLSEALLRAATGAGVNKEEAAQKVREITPQFGDSADLIKQKMDSIPLYLKSLEMRAGPAAKQAHSVLKDVAKTVVKTGTYGGRKVVQYYDGSTDYAD